MTNFGIIVTKADHQLPNLWPLFYEEILIEGRLSNCQLSGYMKSFIIVFTVMIPTGLPGVEVCAETTIVVTNDQQSSYWKGYGLRLNIPKGSLPEGVEQCTIKILASLAGQYEFPEESHLVSGVFWLRCEPMVKFTKLMSVEIQHCAKAENISKLSFVRAVCTQEKLPYTFQQLNQVISTSSSSSYGLTRLQHFSGLGITQEGSQDRGYVAKLFYRNRSISNNYYDIHFVVTWDTDLHHTVSACKQYAMVNLDHE